MAACRSLKGERSWCAARGFQGWWRGGSKGTPLGEAGTLHFSPTPDLGSALNTYLDFGQVPLSSEAWLPPLGNQNGKVHPVYPSSLWGAVRAQRCWVCSETLDVRRAFAE